MSQRIQLAQIAHGRSGDKGNHANIGLIAYSRVGFLHLRKTLTAQWMLERFQTLGVTEVRRYELPNIYAFNFLLFNALAGGASRSLRIDTQGKLLSTALLAMEIDAPPNLDEMLPSVEDASFDS